MQYEHLDLTYLESLIGDDKETKMVILSTLMEEVPEEIEKLEQLSSTQDWHTFHEVSHKFKSTLAYVGNDEIFDANQDMMMAARNMHQLERVPALLAVIKRQWSFLAPEIAQVLAELN